MIEPPVNQAAPHRVKPMQDLIKKHSKKPLKFLEVGTWYGEGSTRIWLDALHPDSSVTLIDYWKSFSSEKDLENKNFDYKKFDELTHNAYMNTIEVVKEYEQKRKLDITLIRGDSKKVLQDFADNTFDFIYIDGSHYYADIKSDIVQAKRIVKQDCGIICGDDYENNPTEEMLNIARTHKDVDFYRGEVFGYFQHYADPQTVHMGSEHVDNYGPPKKITGNNVTYKKINDFHPGVLLAIYEEFNLDARPGRWLEGVNRDDGFWWTYIQNGKFNKDIPAKFNL
jgi:SAM-dependent methyltransferase